MKHRQVENAPRRDLRVVHISAVGAGRPAGHRIPRRGDPDDADHGICGDLYPVKQADSVPHRHLFHTALLYVRPQHAVPREAAHGSLLLQLNLQDLHLQHIPGFCPLHIDGPGGRIDVVPVQAVHHVLLRGDLVVETVPGVEGDDLVLGNADGALPVLAHGIYDLVFDGHMRSPF